MYFRSAVPRAFSRVRRGEGECVGKRRPLKLRVPLACDFISSSLILNDQCVSVCVCVCNAGTAHRIRSRVNYMYFSRLSARSLPPSVARSRARVSIVISRVCR